MKLKIFLVTGCCGFIGFNFVEAILKKNKNLKVHGIYNFDPYYSIKLKKKRLSLLKKYKKFSFNNLDIADDKKLTKFFSKKKIDYVYHFAAQAGVRYAMINQKKYFDSNIHGFFNLLDNLKEKKPKVIFFSSSGSVYGDSKKYPSTENEILYPKNMYSLSKKINEQMAEIYAKQFNIKLIGLRFFTVFGEWGRPDMFLFKYFNSFFKKKTFFLNNNGNHDRDFTYIKDVVEALIRMLKLENKLKNFDLFNICSNNPLNLLKVLSFYKKNNIFPKIKNIKLNKADVLKTHGNNKKLLKTIGNLKFTESKISLMNTLKWYKKNINSF